MRARFLIFLSIGIAFGQASTQVDAGLQRTGWGNVTVENSVSNDSIPLNDTLIVRFRLIITGKPEQYAFADPGTPSVSNLKLVGSSQSNITEGTGSQIKLVKEFKYLYIPQTMGMAYINPMQIQYFFADSGITNTLSTSRLEVKVIEARKPPTKIKWGLILAIFFGVLSIGAITYFLIRGKKSVKQEPEEKAVPPEEKAQKAFRELREDFSRDANNSIEILFNIFMDYLDEKYGANFRSSSIEEIIGFLEKKGVPPRTLGLLRNGLSISYQVRFANLKANQEDVQTVELGFASIISSAINNEMNSNGIENRKSQ